jgi:hypothetical protein
LAAKALTRVDRSEAIGVHLINSPTNSKQMPLPNPAIKVAKVPQFRIADQEIQKKYEHLGSTAWAHPTEEVKPCPDGIGFFRRFGSAMIYWTPATGAHEVHGAILEKWSHLGFERSPLGYPVGDEETAPDGAGRFSRFEKGRVYWSPSTGAHAVFGQVAEKWRSLGREQSYLGYPTGDTDTTAFPSCQFQFGTIVTMPIVGTVAVPEIKRLQGPIVFDDPVAITASYDILLHANGDVNITLSAHCSTKLLTYDYGVVILVETPDGHIYDVRHKGHVANTVFGGANDDVPVFQRNVPMVHENWEQFRSASIFRIGKTCEPLLLGGSLNDLFGDTVKEYLPKVVGALAVL